MERIDNSAFLLFIEPNINNKSLKPVNDIFTEIMKLALSEAELGVSNYTNIDEQPLFYQNKSYKGIHITDCGNTSTNNDYFLKNNMITNSLSVYYLEFFRNYIPKTEMIKLLNLCLFYFKRNQEFNDKPLPIEICKVLKKLGFNLPTYFYYLDKDLPYVNSGLKKVEINKINHNKYDEFIYSAPLINEMETWLNKKDICQIK